MFEIIYDIMYGAICEIIVNILRVLLMKRTIDLFLKSKDEDRNKLKLGYGIYYVLTTALYCVFPVSIPYEIGNLLGIFGVTILYQNTWKKRVWTALLLFSLDVACTLTVSFGFGENYTYQEQAVSVLLLFICVTVISRISYPSGGKEIDFDKKHTLFLAVIPAISIVVLGILFYGNLEGTLALLLCICMLGINLSVFYLYYFMLESYVYLRESELYKQQTIAYQNQMEVIQESQNRMRALRHDMKNHILSLQALLQKNDTGQMAEYLSSMQGFMVNPKEHVQTGNQSIDSLLNYKLQKAEETLLEVKAKINIPEKISLYSFDLNVVLGNLLDNAIEAAGQTEEKKLRLTICMDKGVLFLNIQNSCQGIPDGKWNSLETTKKEKEYHGIGLGNVKRIVEKYQGDMEISCENNMLEIDIMMYAKGL